ncbi:MAG: translocation/assembly module TamB domain-containing protein [Azoarcus sp.]|jgi:translocation and assembly module TamB|nr:translocation/assembly module TamB domain-containing protein [Azoarcus sp.]
MRTAPAPHLPHYGRRWLRRLALCLVVVIALVCATLVWLFAAESGLRTLAGAAARFSDGSLHVEGASGALRGPLALSRLTLDLPDARIELHGVALDWRSFFPRIAVDRLRVARVDVFLKNAPPSPEPPALPESLRLPFAFDLALEIGTATIRSADADNIRDAAPLFTLRESRLSLSGEASRLLLRRLSAELPQGRIEATGELGTTAPFALQVNGHLAGSEFSLDIDAGGSLAEPALHLRAQSHGIRGQATIVATPFAALPLKTVALEAEGIDPAALAPDLPRADLRLSASLSAVLENGRPVLRGPLRIDNARPATFDVGGLPLTRLRADIAAAMDAAVDELRIEALTLEGGGGKLTGHLHWRRQADHAGNAGFGQIDASLNASALDPARLDSRLPASRVNGGGRFILDGANVRDADIKLDVADNRLELAGSWGQTKDRLTLNLDAPRLAVIGFGLAGRMRAVGTITGGRDAPTGMLRLDASGLRLPGNVAAAALAGEARIEAGGNGPLALKLNGSGIVAGDLRLASAKIMADGQRDRHRIQIEAEGVFKEVAARINAALDGGLDALYWRGQLLALKNEGRWPLRLRAPAALEISPEEFSLVEAGFDIGEQGNIQLAEIRWKNSETVLRGNLAGLALTMLPGQGRRPRDPLTLGAVWDLRIDESIEGEARLFRESGDIAVQGEITARLGLERLEAHLLARNRKLTLTLAAQAREAGELGISLDAGIERAGQSWRPAPHAPLTGAAHIAMPSLVWLGRLSRENIETGGTLTADITLSGTPAAPDLQGNIRGSALQLALADHGLILSGGELEAAFTHHDGYESLHLERLAFESANRIKPRDKRVPVDKLTATPGHLLATGDIVLNAATSPDDTRAPRGRIEFTAERLPLLQRPDRWLLMSGRGRATLQGKALDIDASLLADAGYIEIDSVQTPALGNDVIVHRAGAPEGEADAAQKTDGPIAITGKIALDPGRALYLDAFGIDTRLAGGLVLQFTPSDPPRALGAIRTVDGSYRGYGQRLSIEHGAITFQGELDNPGLNIIAMRRGMEVDAGVAITGDARHPQVRLVSEPAVPDPEKLSWLVLGRAPDAGGADLGLLVPAAQALFGGPGGGMTEELTRGLGIDSFTIGQGDLNSSSRSAASKVVSGGSRISAGQMTASDVVAVGKRLTNELSLSFEQSLTGVESLVKLTYRLDRRLSLVARGGTDNAFDIYYTFTIGDKDKQKKARTGQ